MSSQDTPRDTQDVKVNIISQKEDESSVEIELLSGHSSFKNPKLKKKDNLGISIKE